MANEGQAVMRAAGIAIPKSAIAHSLDEAVRAAEEIGYPVVMKVVSRDILHKSDAGGVALDLVDRNEVIDAYQAILRNCRAYKADAAIDGVEVSEMVKTGTETIVGARRDATFGPIIMFGLGGIYVEVMKDVAFRALPINRKEIMSMVKQIRAYPLLLGVRGEEKKDVDSVVDSDHQGGGDHPEMQADLRHRNQPLGRLRERQGREGGGRADSDYQCQEGGINE